MASAFYDKDGNMVVVEDDKCPKGMFDTPFGKDTKEEKPKAAPKKKAK